MSAFDFLLALYSIVAGLGMSVIVRSIGQMIEARGRVRLYWVHCCLIAVAFVGQVVSWFSLWRFADHSPWTVADTLFLLSIPFLLYLVGHLVVPDLEDELVHDMREYYYRHAQWTHGLLLAVLLPGILTASPRVHSVQAAAMVLLMALGVSYVSTPIG